MRIRKTQAGFNVSVTNNDANILRWGALLAVIEAKDTMEKAFADGDTLTYETWQCIYLDRKEIFNALKDAMLTL